MAEPLHQAAAAGRTLPERITDHLVARIFSGALAPGERLPPDRVLAQQLGVDRTSLRMAMQRLSQLGLVKAVQGSGVRVLDYRRHAGADLLAAVFQLPSFTLGGGVLLDALDHWLDTIPITLGRALTRMTRAAARELDAILLRQLAVLESGGDPDELAALEVELHDGFARIAGSTALMLLGNSSRSARLRLAREHFAVASAREHIDTHRALLAKALQSKGRPAGELAIEYRTFLERHTEPLRRQLRALPVDSVTEQPLGKAPKRAATHRPRRRTVPG